MLLGLVRAAHLLKHSLYKHKTLKSKRIIAETVQLKTNFDSQCQALTYVLCTVKVGI